MTLPTFASSHDLATTTAIHINPDEITFLVGGEVRLRLCADGSAWARDRLIDDDPRMADALREWIGSLPGMRDPVSEVAVAPDPEETQSESEAPEKDR